MRFLHTADWQLGMTRHFLDDDAQPRYTAARTDAVRSVGQVAEATGCELVLVCGDVFESNQVSPRVVSRSLDALAGIHVPVYLLPGNHDPLDAASIYRSAAFAGAPENVHVLGTPGCHPVRPGVEIVAAPWSSKRPLGDTVGAVVENLPADGVLRVVAGHGRTDLLSADARDPARIRLADVEQALAAGSVHYVALGDRHSTTDVGSTGRVWYSGTPEATDYDEVDPGNVLVVDVDLAGPPRVARHQVGRWAFRDLGAELTGRADVAALDAALAALPDRDRCVVRLSLVGSLSLADKAVLDGVLAAHEQVLASLSVWDKRSDLAVYVDDDALGALGLSGFAAGAVHELARAAHGHGGDADAAQVARDALSLAFRLTGAGR